MAERKKLRDILRGTGDLSQAWDSTEAADEHSPLPAGTYRCRIADGTLFESRSGTPGYKLCFEVVEGEHARRRVWCDLWLTPAAMPIAKRELGKLGISSPDQLDSPLPEGFVADVKVAIRRGDDGRTYNSVRTFAVVGFEPPAPDPFAPKVEPTSPTTEATTSETPADDDMEVFEL